MHNVDVDAISAAAAQAETDPDSATIRVHLGGMWHTEPDHAQFTSEVAFPEGIVTLAADFPPPLGGRGRAPAALAYCYYGVMCCYASTFATQAAMEGVELDALSATIDVEVDLRSALGLGDYDPMSGIQLHLEVASTASEEQLDRIKELADERCPATWAMNHQIPQHVVVTKLA